MDFNMTAEITYNAPPEQGMPLLINLIGDNWSVQGQCINIEVFDWSDIEASTAGIFARCIMGKEIKWDNGACWIGSWSYSKSETYMRLQPIW